MLLDWISRISMMTMAVGWNISSVVAMSMTVSWSSISISMMLGVSVAGVRRIPIAMMDRLISITIMSLGMSMSIAGMGWVSVALMMMHRLVAISVSIAVSITVMGFCRLKIILFFLSSAGFGFSFLCISEGQDGEECHQNKSFDHLEEPDLKLRELLD